MADETAIVATADNPMDAEWIRDRLALEDVESTVEYESASDHYRVCVTADVRDRAKAILDEDEQTVFSEDDAGINPKPVDTPHDGEIETEDDPARTELAQWIGKVSPGFLICFPLAPVGLWYLIRLHRMPGTLGMAGRAELPLAWFMNVAGTFLLLTAVYLVFRP